MEDLKSTLRKLATRRPSTDLDERILGLLESARSPDTALRIGLGWAVAAAVVVGALGFWSGISWRDAADGGADRSGSPGRVDESPASKTIQIVVGPSDGGNPFDFSPRLGNDSTGEWKTVINLESTHSNQGGPGQ